MNVGLGQNQSLSEVSSRRLASSERVTKALTSLPVGRGLVQLGAEIFVGCLIEEFPLDTHQRSAQLPGKNASLLNSFSLLKCVSRADRVGFFTQVINRALSPGKRKETSFLAAVLTQAGYWLHPVERRKLLEELSQGRRNGITAKCWVALARSAERVEQIHHILQRCGRDKLLDFSSRELKELVVTIEVAHCLRAIAIPEKPSSHVTNSTALQIREEQLRRALKAARTALGAMSWAKGTTRYARFKSMVKTSEQSLNARLEKASTPGEKNRALRAEIERIQLEFRFGKSCIHDSSRLWTESELQVVSRALEITGEYRNICSSVYEIKRSGGLEGACGILTLCGTRIELEDRCFSEKKGAAAERGGYSPLDVVVHEIGHSFSMVPADRLVRRARKTGGININEWFAADHFPEMLLRIGRWSGITDGFHVSDASIVTVFGKDVPLEVGVRMQGDHRQHLYEHQYGCLFWYSLLDGEFPRHKDSRADPAEYFAEGFCDYHRAPDQLIEHAPNLFWYLESIYHHYNNDSNIFERLRDRLKTRTVSLPQQIPVEADAFSLLQRREQMSVLEQIRAVPARWQKCRPDAVERQAVFTRACIRGHRPRVLAECLHTTLSTYNPALLLARSFLFAGQEVSIVSIRGSDSAEHDSQELLRKELELILGPRFYSENIFLFGDPKSKRFQSESYHEKLVSFITERTLGLATRQDGQHKYLSKKYDRVVLYTNMLPTANYVRQFAKKHKIHDLISVVAPRDIDPSHAARIYLTSSRDGGDHAERTLYVFTLEDVLEIPAKFYIRLHSGRVLRTLSLKEFLLKPDISYWLRIVSGQSKAYHKSDLVFDSSEFTSEQKLASFLKDGREDALMLRHRAGEVD